MVTTEEKISVMKKFVKSSEELGDSDLIEQTNIRLKELQEWKRLFGDESH